MAERRTRGEYEAELTRAIIKLEKEYMGRGPLEARTFFVSDMVVVRLRGVMTPAELKLVETLQGQALVKETRRQLFDTMRPLIEQAVSETLGCKVVSLHADMSTRTDERVVVLTVDADLEERFR